MQREGGAEMTLKEARPDVEKIMSRLKSFQRQTVEYVYRRLYEDSDKVNRFLIADEVGLGKTLVAKGVIAKAVDRLWDEVKRIDIIYICSNQDIARQNINRLNITDQEIIPADRMTMLPLHLHQIQDRKLNFVALTPGTSFDLKSKSGTARERALIYHILLGEFYGEETGPKNLFQDRKDKDLWRNLLDEFDPSEIDEDLARKFRQKVKQNQQICASLKNLIKKFSHYRKYENIPEEEDQARDKLIGDLRRILAESCVQALEPDIVIMDEFQRFKDLLESAPEDPAKAEVARLAQALFNYKDAEQRNVKIILLSATPYKMYTMHSESAESGEDHYEDFLKTMRFLFKSEDEVQELRNELENYQKELYRMGTGSSSNLLSVKERIEKKLRRVMVRTERLSVTPDRNGMLIESKNDLGSLSQAELKSFVFLDRISQKLGVYDPMEYWKSAPYLLNLMDTTYQLKNKFMEAIEIQANASELAETISQFMDNLLFWRDINSYKRVDPANSKLRTLMEHTIYKGAWKLLWVPASLPYYQVPFGPYAEESLKNFSKALIFSSWYVVPKVIATMCSYEAERLTMSSEVPDEPKRKYQERSSQTGLIKFSISEGRLTGMPNFTLIYPCISLAEKIDPLAIAVSLSQDGPPALETVLKTVMEKIEAMIKPITSGFKGVQGRVDGRWYWAILALLDAQYYGRAVKEWLETEDEELNWTEMIRARGEEEEESDFSEHIAQFRKYFDKTKPSLGAPPKDLAIVLTKVALASPAVVALRSLRRCVSSSNKNTKISLPHLLSAAARIGLGFRSLFNQPEAISIVKSLNAKNESKPQSKWEFLKDFFRGASSQDASFWESALDYCVNGNLQAVMDEYVHILIESLGVADKSPNDAFKEIAETIQGALSLRTASLGFDEIRVNANQIEEPKKRRVRCSFALRFGDEKDEEGKEVTRKESVRNAFNSPFRPFILATTSIGQEGLDFHQYCYEVYHWNLPSNPVDLEQREGRIHRYKGHAIRRNIALAYKLQALSGIIEPFTDPWSILFNLARNHHQDKTDLVPYWIFEVPDGYRIIRHIPALPLSRELDTKIRLKKSLAVYRMVFGQPRQEDLVEYLIKKGVNEGALAELRIELSPG